MQFTLRQLEPPRDGSELAIQGCGVIARDPEDVGVLIRVAATVPGCQLGFADATEPSYGDSLRVSQIRVQFCQFFVTVNEVSNGVWREQRYCRWRMRISKAVPRPSNEWDPIGRQADHGQNHTEERE